MDGSCTLFKTADALGFERLSAIIELFGNKLTVGSHHGMSCCLEVLSDGAHTCACNANEKIIRHALSNLGS